MRIAQVYAWQNGTVMVFDQNGKQMDQFQGRLQDKWTEIAAAADEGTQFHIGQWRVDARQVPRATLERLAMPN
jgi:hypothetical protein